MNYNYTAPNGISYFEVEESNLRAEKSMSDFGGPNMWNLYVKNFTATFLPIPSFSSDLLNSKEINLDHGKFIFERACMHCHEKGNYSFYHLDRSKMTFKHLEQAARSENYIFSMFYLVREGLEPRKGHQSHMPLFTAERMSPQQLNSLYAYVYSVSR